MCFKNIRFFLSFRGIVVVISIFSLLISAPLPLLSISKYEVRAVWLTTINNLDWPLTRASSPQSVAKQKRELCDILDKLQTANVNTVLFQTRLRGTVAYNSSIEPWDGAFSGTAGISPGYDVLSFAIEECHKRGMEIHAWIVTLPVGNWSSFGCEHLRKKYPSMIKRIGKSGYMNPESTETSAYLGRLCREIVDKYDIDGIHLDFIRYPEKWRLTVSRDIARANITAIVRTIHHQVKASKPWVKMSSSPIGKYADLLHYSSRGWNAYVKGCQDVHTWLREGLMDEVFPMMYYRGDQFYPFAVDWQEHSYGRIIVAGLGIYFLSSSEGNWPINEVKRQIWTSRSLGMGHAYFRSQYLTSDIKGLYKYITLHADPYPSLIPAMSWLNIKPPSPPLSLSFVRMVGGDFLSWETPMKNYSESYLLYNVYMSHTWPVDISDPSNLIATRKREKTLFIKDGSLSSDAYYAVTATDRYGNESLPIMTPEPEKYLPSNKLLQTDGHFLTLPEKSNVNDAKYLLIETLQGGMLCTRPYRGAFIDISSLSNGVYVLKSLGNKGVTHRLGYFIKRTKKTSF